MSTAITMFNPGAQLPAHLQGRDVDATTKALSGGVGGGRRISIKGAVFRMIVDGKQVAENEDRAMNVVIVNAAPYVNRQFYAGAYQEGAVESPTCYSSNSKTPDKDIAVPQSVSCDGCKQNIAGSGQGESRACRYQQRLAVVLEGEIDGPIYQLALPATSLFGKGEPNNVKMPLQAYAKYLATNGTPIAGVVTEMRFDTASATPKLTFKPTRFLEADEFAIAETQGDSADANRAIALSVFKQDTAKGKPAPAAAAAAPAAEPTVAPKAKPVAPVAPKKTAAEVVAEWDD